MTLAGQDPELLRENYIVLMVMQATLGEVSPPMLAVATRVENGEIHVYFALAATDASVQEDIEDIIADVEGQMLPETPNVYQHVHLGPVPHEWKFRPYRLTYLAKS